MPAATPHKALVDLETKFWQSMSTKTRMPRWSCSMSRR
jgi:hypothetical protein